MVTDGIECRETPGPRVVPLTFRRMQAPYMAAPVWVEGDKVPSELCSKLMVPMKNEDLMEYDFALKNTKDKLPGF